MVIVLRSGFRVPEIKFQSLKFLLPSIIYTINNNIYLAGLIHVPPPVWMILCSFRTVVTVCVYKYLLGKKISNIQFLGSFLIVGGIVCAKLGQFRLNAGSDDVKKGL